jgi:hypothetical protein
MSLAEDLAVNTFVKVTWHHCICDLYLWSFYHSPTRTTETCKASQSWFISNTSQMQVRSDMLSGMQSQPFETYVLSLFWCGNLPQGGFTLSDQAVFIVTSSGKLCPFSWHHNTDLASSQSAQSICELAKYKKRLFGAPVSVGSKSSHASRLLAPADSRCSPTDHRGSKHHSASRLPEDSPN